MFQRVAIKTYKKRPQALLKKQRPPQQPLEEVSEGLVQARKQFWETLDKDRSQRGAEASGRGGERGDGRRGSDEEEEDAKENENRGRLDLNKALHPQPSTQKNTSKPKQPSHLSRQRRYSSSSSSSSSDSDSNTNPSDEDFTLSTSKSKASIKANNSNNRAESRSTRSKRIVPKDPKTSKAFEALKILRNTPTGNRTAARKVIQSSDDDDEEEGESSKVAGVEVDKKKLQVGKKLFRDSDWINKNKEDPEEEEEEEEKSRVLEKVAEQFRGLEVHDRDSSAVSRGGNNKQTKSKKATLEQFGFVSTPRPIKKQEISVAVEKPADIALAAESDSLLTSARNDVEQQNTDVNGVLIADTSVGSSTALSAEYDSALDRAVLFSFGETSTPQGQDEEELSDSKTEKEEKGEVATDLLDELNNSDPKIAQSGDTCEEDFSTHVIDETDEDDRATPQNLNFATPPAIEPRAAIEKAEDSLLAQLLFTPPKQIPTATDFVSPAAEDGQFSVSEDAQYVESQHAPYAVQPPEVVTVADTDSLMDEMLHTLEGVLKLCNQTEPVSFETALSGMRLVGKLQEASYSEVFSYLIPPKTDSNMNDKQNAPRTPFKTLSSARSTRGSKEPPSISAAVKVVPFHGARSENGEVMTIPQLAQEVLVTRALSSFNGFEVGASTLLMPGDGVGLGSKLGELTEEKDGDGEEEIEEDWDVVGSNFVQLISVSICKGPYPDDLLEAWDCWEAEKGTYNERPSEFPPDELYAVLVLRNGGSDLEHYKLRKWSAARSLLLQLTLSLAAAETSLKFEHRDLHWGNVLCMDLKESPGACKRFSVSSAGSTLNRAHTKKNENMCVEVESAGLKATIIDYTWSRCQQGNTILYNAMVDESIFTGDAEEDYQYEIYRMMRAEVRDNWEGFHPRTTVMWMHYLIDKILTVKKTLPRVGAASIASRKALEALRDRVLRYHSMTEMVEGEIINGLEGDFFYGGYRIVS
ncbi:hypothetical protein HDV05_001085 [Chytridiales sp. JEL 0842]|nr:hypothetical protein HDV05_001085 [Chytridiales sp. JEL 0842]